MTIFILKDVIILVMKNAQIKIEQKILQIENPFKQINHIYLNLKNYE
jgi:hypothetical protein